MTLYAKVKAACKESGTNISQLENDLGFARGTLYKWAEHTPSIEKVYMVAQKLNRPLEYFIEDKGA